MTQIIALGLMTGTSMDGIDAAAILTNGLQLVEHIAHISLEYEPAFKHQLQQAANWAAKHPGQSLPPKIRVLEEELTYLHAQLSQQLLQQLELLDQRINIIGFSGQTLYHCPKLGISLQLGDGALLSKALGIAVVNNFRQPDIQAGGQGAPLAPLYHWALAAKDSPIALVNIGGIANISFVTQDIHTVRGYDVGPGNFLLDRYIAHQTDGRETMDLNGQYGLHGQVQRELLGQLETRYQNFVQSPSPKSLDISDLWQPNYAPFSITDVCATLAYFTAWCIVQSLIVHPYLSPKKLVLTGGGSYNPAICEYIKQLLLQNGLHETHLVKALEMAWHEKYMEAELFAYLAARRILGMPTSYPSITGVTHPISCGDVFDNTE
jgi:anhydro-N-acetylmuramic acid kinase